MISTYAGSDWIFPSDQRPAVEAPLSEVSQFAVDPLGRVYFADEKNHLVLRLNLNGTLDVLAGNGVAGFSGDGGAARLASLDGPSGVALDAAGNLYVADRNNNRVRRVRVDGTIETVAGTGASAFGGDGGPATSAGMDPFVLGIDSAGNVLVADAFNARIRRFQPGGTITTIAGNGRFDYSGDGGPAIHAGIDPQGLAVDAAGNIYVADWSNSRIRRIGRDGIITTIAGTGEDGDSGDDGPALRARIDNPSGLWVDRNGNVFFADTNNYRVRRISPAGIISAVAGTGELGDSGDNGPARAAQFIFPSAVAVDDSGRMYIADNGTFRIRLVEGNIVRTVAGNGRFHVVADGTPASLGYLNRPGAIALDGRGNLLIADSLNHRIRRVGSDGALFNFAGTGANACCRDGGPAIHSLLSYPRGLAVDAQGNLIFADSGNERIRRIGTDGVITTLAGTGATGSFGDGGPAAEAAFNFPWDVAVDATGNIYVADMNNHRVRRIAPNGTITTVAGTGRGGFSGDGGPATSAQLNRPRGLAIDRSGNLLIADSLNQRIRRVTPAGVITTVAGIGRTGGTGDGGPATQAAIDAPYDVAVDSSNNIFILEAGGDRVRRVGVDGVISTVAGSGRRGFGGDGGPALGALFESPFSLAVDASGQIFIADTFNNRVRVVRSSRPALQVSPTTINLGSASGTAAVTARVAVGSSIAGLAFTATASEPWLSLDTRAGTAPATLEVRADARTLAPNRYTGTVTIASPVATPPSVTVNVAFTVTPGAPPRLEVSTDALTFSVSEGSGPVTGSLNVLNDGSGTLNFTAAARSITGGNWLQVSPTSGSAVPGQPGSLTVTANPGSLRAGSYTGVVQITAGRDVIPVPVTLSLRGSPRTILLSQSGLTFTAVAGGGVPAPQSFGVLNIGSGTLDWTAEAQGTSGGSWLNVLTRSGRVNRPFLDVSQVDIAVDHRGLGPGDYYGKIEVRGAADNSPQVTSVLLKVLPEGSNPGPDVRPTGLIFTGVAGSNPGAQTVTVTNLGRDSATYDSSKIGAWFAHVPAKARILANQPGRIVVQPNFSGLAPGIQRGAITLQFEEDGTIRNVNLLTVVAPPGAQADKDGRLWAVGCASPNLEVLFSSLQPGFTAVVGEATHVEARVVDACGNPLVPNPGRATTQVVARFSTHDPQLNLNHVGNGVWSGAWRPVRAVQGSVRIVVTALFAEGNTRQAGQREIAGSVREGGRAPLVTAGGVVHGASFAAQQPIAPGSLITVYGANLADGAGSAPGIPLPLEMHGAQVLLGDRPLPLVFTSAGQVNAQVPFDVPVNTQHQLVARRADAISVPETLTVATAQPGIFSKNQRGSGQGIIVRADGALAEPGTPVQRGGVIVIYCTGLGPVNPPVQAGLPAPSSPLSVTVNPVTLTLGGRTAQVLFSGLTPGFTGLYQVNAIVPQDAPQGDSVEVILSVAGQNSPPVTLAVR